MRIFLHELFHIVEALETDETEDFSRRYVKVAANGEVGIPDEVAIGVVDFGYFVYFELPAF